MFIEAEHLARERARKEADRRRRQREAEARAEQHRIEAEEKEDAAKSEFLQWGRSMVGVPVRVHWGEGGSYVGRVTEFNEYEGKHKVVYTDGDVKWHDLNKMRWSEVSEAELKPRQVQRGELSSSILPPPLAMVICMEWMNRFTERRK